MRRLSERHFRVLMEAAFRRDGQQLSYDGVSGIESRLPGHEWWTGGYLTVGWSPRGGYGRAVDGAPLQWGWELLARFEAMKVKPVDAFSSTLYAETIGWNWVATRQIRIQLDATLAIVRRLRSDDADGQRRGDAVLRRAVGDLEAVSVQAARAHAERSLDLGLERRELVRLLEQARAGRDELLELFLDARSRSRSESGRCCARAARETPRRRSSRACPCRARRARSRGVRVEQREPCDSAVRRERAQAEPLEHARGRRAHRRFVVDDEHRAALEPAARRPRRRAPRPAARSTAAGRSRTSSPSPSSESTVTVPRAFLTTPHTSASPRPVPLPIALVVKNGSNTRARVAASMPVPVSVTRRRT